MTPTRWRVTPRTMAAVVLAAATLAVGTGLAPGPGAATMRAAGVGPAKAAPGQLSPALTAARRGTIRLGTAGSITLDAAGSGRPTLPADPNVDPNAFRSCQDIRTPLAGVSTPTLFYHDPDPPAGQQQVPGEPTDFMEWGGFTVLGISPDEANSSDAGGWSNTSKLAGSAFVPPFLTVGDYLRTYPNPPLKPLPDSDPNTIGIWHSADPSTDSPGGSWTAGPTPTADNLVYYCQLLLGQLDDAPTAKFPPTNAQAAFPSVRATFLSFGFTPVTATVHIQEQTSGGSLIPVTEVAYQQYKHYDQITGQVFPPHEGCPGIPTAGCGFNYCQGGVTGSTCSDYVITVTAAVTLRLSDVIVNGTPLNVGPHCQTTGPLYTAGNRAADPGNDRVVLQGGSDTAAEPFPQWQNVGVGTNGGGVFNGGAVAGFVTIPPFTGCVTAGGENLDPLLDASVSGPGNYVKMTAGGACTDFSPALCTNGTFPFQDPQARALPPEKIYR